MPKLNPNLTVPMGMGESPSSLCSRTAYLCRRSVSDFCLDMGMTFTRVVNGEAVAIKKLADVCAADWLDLSRNVAVRFDRKNFEWNGQLIHLAGINRLKVRVCAHCLSEDVADVNVPLPIRPYSRAIWALSGIRTCKKHSVGLVTISSNERFGVAQDFVSVVGPRLSQLGKLMLASLDQRFSKLEEYLVSRVGGTSTIGHWLDSVRVDATVRICELVGGVAMHGSKSTLRSFGEAELHTCAENGFQLLVSKNGLTELCNELKNECLSKNLYPTGLNVFGPIWSKYYHKSESDGFHPFYDRLRQYAVENLPVGPGDDMFGTFTACRKWHSIRTAAAEFSLSHTQAKKLALSSGLLEEISDHGRRNTFFVDADKFTQYLGRVQAALTLSEALAYLDLPRQYINAIMDSGYLIPLVRRGDALGRYLFEKTNLDEFLQNLLRDASPLAQPQQGLCNIPNAASQASTNVASIVGLLFSRKLKKVFNIDNRPAFSSVLVHSDEISSLLHDTRKQGYTAVELNKKLGARSVSVRALIRHGILPSSIHKCWKSGQVRPLVTAKDVEAFQRKYIGSFELGLLLRMRAKDVVEKCSIHKIEPAFDPEIVKSRYYIRSEVPWI